MFTYVCRLWLRGVIKRQKDNVKNRQRNNILGFNQIFMIDVMK